MVTKDDCGGRHCSDSTRPLLASVSGSFGLECRICSNNVKLLSRSIDSYDSLSTAQDATNTHFRHLTGPLPRLHCSKPTQHNLHPTSLRPSICADIVSHLPLLVDTQPYEPNFNPRHKIHKRHTPPCHLRLLRHRPSHRSRPHKPRRRRGRFPQQRPTRRGADKFQQSHPPPRTNDPREIRRRWQPRPEQPTNMPRHFQNRSPRTTPKETRDATTASQGPGRRTCYKIPRTELGDSGRRPKA